MTQKSAFDQARKSRDVKLMAVQQGQQTLSCSSQSTNAMNGGLRRTVTVTNPQGLHLRPIQVFVETAAKFQSEIYVRKGNEQRINGKSPIGLLGLGAEQGTELTLEVSGPDEQAALEALVDLLANIREEDSEPPSLPPKG